MDPTSALLGFVLGASWWFWIIVILESAFIFASIEKEELGGAFGFVTACIATALLWWVTSVAVWDILPNDTLSALIAIAVYILIGLVTSWVKWYFFLKRHAKKLADALRDFLNTYLTSVRRQEEIPEELRTETFKKAEGGEYTSALKKLFREYYRGDKEVTPPVWNKHKNLIASWILFWPWVWVWGFFRNIAINGLNNLIAMFSGVYNRIGRRAYSGLDPDFFKE